MRVDLRVRPYAASIDHLMAELERLDLMIRHYVTAARELQPQDDPYRGLYISSTDFDALVEAPAGMPGWAMATPRDRLDGALAQIAASIEARAQLAKARGVRLRLLELQGLFELSPRDVDVLLICIAPELDIRYERIFAYLHDDVTRRRPTVDLTLNLLCGSFAEKLAARASLGPEAALRRHGLIEVFEDPAQPRATLLGQCLKLDPRVLAYLLGDDEIDARLKPFARLTPPGPGASKEPDRLELACELQRGSPLLHLHGPRGVGKKRLAAALFARLGLRTIQVDAGAMLAVERERFDALARVAMREAKLLGAGICWDGADVLFAAENRRVAASLVEALEAAGAPAILTGLLAWDRAIASGPTFASLELPAPGAAERAEIWAAQLKGERALQREVAGLASRFRFTAGDIAAVLGDARASARTRDPAQPRITAADLYASCRERSTPRLGELARKVRTSQRWPDLVLPEESMRQLHEICDRVNHRADVMDDWGFGAKLSLGKGLSALFAGPSGAGKTMAAGIIAAELGLDLYRIDLSAVVSKYIGETEKNLARIFAEAEQSSAILFFDEADALFGKRSEVRDSHDRHANVEISYLLQRMEDYEGVSILATNLRRNMDDAFTRRIAFIVQFPAPEAPDRLRIWRGVFPAETPLAADLDLDYMARQFKLSGGNIRNIAIAAAFLAASETRAPARGVVTMSHLVRATRRELQKLGKVAGASDFAEYAHLREEDGRAAG